MAGIDIIPGKFFIKQDHKAIGDITATLDVTGDKHGTIVVSFARGSATVLVQCMLGGAADDNDMRDAVGEVTNMISGRARATMSEAGIVLRTPTPTVTTDNSLNINYTAEAPVVVIPFTERVGKTGTAFVVEFCLSAG
jgi:chemotaxis protein CheX